MDPEIQKIKDDLQALTNEFYRNNFSARQDFYKFSDFKTGLKVPNYSATPATGEVGELIQVSGKLYVCSAANTWTVAGSQS